MSSRNAQAPKKGAQETCAQPGGIPSAVLAAITENPQPAPSEDRLELLRQKVREVRDMRIAKADLEERTKVLSKQIIEAEQKTLPDMFDELNVDNLGLPPEGNLPGYDAKAAPYYHANIPEEGAVEAFSWLQTNGHADLVKTVITVQLGRGERKAAQRLEKFLNAEGISYTSKLGVPWNTLTAWLKEQVEKHKTMPPLAILGATVGRIVKLKERK